jgi:hypothetical protein
VLHGSNPQAAVDDKTELKPADVCTREFTSLAEEGGVILRTALGYNVEVRDLGISRDASDWLAVRVSGMGEFGAGQKNYH